MSQSPDWPLELVEHDMWYALRTGQLPLSDVLDGLPEEARSGCWRWLRAAVEDIVLYQQSLPEGHTLDPEPALRHLGQPPLETGRLAGQPQANLHRLVRLEGWVAVEALEVFMLCPARRAEALALLRAQMSRLGLLYQEWVRRTWVGVAVPLLEWEVRLLRYRASRVLAPLLWGEAA